MAHHKSEEEDTSSPVEVEEDKEVVIPCGGHGDLPNEHDGGFSSIRPTSCLLPARSLRSTTAIPAAHQVQSQANDDGRASRSLSFSKLLSFRVPSSLFTLGYSDQTDDDAATSDSSILTRICRSQSVPTSVRRFNGRAGSRRVSPAAGFQVRQFGVLVSDDDPQGVEEAESIGEREALCRICMVALSDTEEGGAVLKLECCCKGELALAHEGCAIKWFSIKGNGACDVCGQEVRNLPVTLHTRHPSSAQAGVAVATQATPTTTTSTTSHRYSRVWHGTPILVIISMLAYFCFLEQLLVGDHGTAALAISLPFACVLGLFSSLTTTKMVSRRYVWIYSALQFLFIVLFTNLFYRYVRMQAVIVIILSTFAGFSVSICTNSVLLKILRWRASRIASPVPAIAEDQEETRGHRVVDLEIGQPPP